MFSTQIWVFQILYKRLYIVLVYDSFKVHAFLSRSWGSPDNMKRREQPIKKGSYTSEPQFLWGAIFCCTDTSLLVANIVRQILALIGTPFNLFVAHDAITNKMHCKTTWKFVNDLERLSFSRFFLKSENLGNVSERNLRFKFELNCLQMRWKQIWISIHVNNARFSKCSFCIKRQPAPPCCPCTAWATVAASPLLS